MYFSSDSVDLDGTAILAIKLVFSNYRLHKPGFVSISAHADTVGNKKYNKSLSRHRSSTVANILMELGVPRKSITRVAHGEEKPAVKTDDNINEKYNRVVKITFER